MSAVLPFKTRVFLPDGETGIVVKQDGPDVYVLQPQKRIGRGPWIFPRASLEVA